MPLKYVGPDATNADDLITLGQADSRYAAAASSATLQAQIDTLETGQFGSSTRTQKPYCEVRLTTQYSNGANTDMYAGAGWTAAVDTDGMFMLAGTNTGNGYSTYTRIKTPIAGRYRIDLTVLSAGATAHNAACKILTQTGTTQPTIAANSIASDFGPAAASTEGKPLHAHTTAVLAASQYIYWSTWRSVAGNISTTNFGAIRTSITAEWIGPI